MIHEQLYEVVVSSVSHRRANNAMIERSCWVDARLGCKQLSLLRESDEARPEALRWR